jgi:hypothetical protein
MAFTPPDEKMTTPPRQAAADQAFQMTTSLRADDIFADSLHGWLLQRSFPSPHGGAGCLTYCFAAQDSNPPPTPGTSPAPTDNQPFQPGMPGHGERSSAVLLPVSFAAW